MIQITNEDNMELMARYEDNHFDLAIVDPPYGLERLKKGSLRLGGIKGNYKDSLKWDNKPLQDYWNELFRVSKNQIVWGANNFVMPPSEYFCIWNKKQTVDNFATAEYAWVSMGLKKPAKMFDYSIHKHNQTDKIHPTEKPIQLYEWLLINYAQRKCDHKHEEHNRHLCTDCRNQDVKILDTHLGSGSIAIACHNLGFDLTACELDKEYFDAAMKRLKQHQAQLTMF
jgi:site-specific DNA-methyltransferase (adenine-specific)